MAVGSSKTIIWMERLQFHTVNHTWFLRGQWMLVLFSMKQSQRLTDLEITMNLKSFYRQFIIRLKYVMNLQNQICRLGSCPIIHIIHSLARGIMQFLSMASQEAKLTKYFHHQHGRLQSLYHRQIYMIVSHWVLQLTIQPTMPCLQEYNGSCRYHWFRKYLWYKMMNYGTTIHSHKCLRRSFWLLEMHHLLN